MLLIPHQNLLSNQRALDKSILCFSTLYFSLHFFLVFLVQLDLFLNCKQFISRKHSNLEFIVCLFHTFQTFSLSCPIFTRLFPITILLSVSVLSLCMSFLILHVTSLRRLLTPSIMGINCPQSLNNYSQLFKISCVRRKGVSLVSSLIHHVLEFL